MVILGISHPNDDLTTIVTYLFGAVCVVWLVLALIGRGRP